MEAWTDYPIAELGDEPYKEAPVRQVEVVSYDRNKYCMVRVEGVESLLQIKAGYLYSYPKRNGTPVVIEKLKTLPKEPT